MPDLPSFAVLRCSNGNFGGSRLPRYFPADGNRFKCGWKKRVTCRVVDAAQRYRPNPHPQPPRSGRSGRAIRFYPSISSSLAKTVGGFRARLEPFCPIPGMTEQGSESRAVQGPFGAITLGDGASSLTAIAPRFPIGKPADDLPQAERWLVVTHASTATW